VQVSTYNASKHLHATHLTGRLNAVSNDTETKILTAAAELFSERGYAGTTTRAIAGRAGVNEVTLFRRFENKAGVSCGHLANGGLRRWRA